MLDKIPFVKRKYGALPAHMELNLPDNSYITILGENNVGKSTLLQYLFTQLMEDGSLHNKICFLPKNRDFTQISTQPGSATLTRFNQELYSIISSNPIDYQESTKANFPLLYNVLINNSDYHQQLGNVIEAVQKSGFGMYKIAAGQTQQLNGYPITTQGSAIRCQLPIIAAISDPEMKYILIDEPEASLEAGRAKLLKKDLERACRENGKTVIVATHSHLFLNNETPDCNFLLKPDKDAILSLTRIKDEFEFYDIAFKMFGNSLSDLYLPNNMMFVEGASDQVLVEKVKEILKIDEKSFRVVACNSVDEVGFIMKNFERNLKPIFAGRSPYTGKIVTLVDKPNAYNKKDCEELEKYLKDRYFELNSGSLEEYLDETLYKKGGLDKATELAELSKETNYQKKSAIKENISTKISSTLEEGDLKLIPIIVEAVKKTVN